MSSTSDTTRLFLASDPSLNTPASSINTPEVPRHFKACIFHILFKSLAIATYLFSSLFTNSFILTFVACILLLAVDFWLVKNISGRLLVGLRWWSEVLENGETKWIFETKPQDRPVHPSDSLWFWGGLYITPIIWMVFGITALTSLRISNLLIVVTALTLSLANVIGYWKCQRNAGSAIKAFIANRL